MISVGLRQVSADDAGADQGGLGGEAVGELQRPGGVEVGRGTESDEQRRGAAAHRVDVGEVLGGRLVADVGRRRPVEPEVPVLHEQVDRRDDRRRPTRTTAASSPGPDHDVVGLREPRRQSTRPGRTRRRRQSDPDKSSVMARASSAVPGGVASLSPCRVL